MKKTESTELTVIERAAVALGTSEREAQLAELVKESSTIVAIKNNAGRDQCHSAAMKLRTTRVEIEKAGKAAREDATAFSKAVIAEEKRLVAITGPEEERLLGLRDVWDEAREAERRAKVEAEARRVAGLRARIEAFMLDAVTVSSKSAAEIDAEANRIAEMVISLDEFAEMAGNAQAKRDETVAWLRVHHTKALAREVEAKRLAEENERLARERAEFEEQQRLAAAERAEQERRDAAARAEQERIERARRDAEEAQRRATLEKADAIMRAEREAHEQRMAADRAELQRRQDEAAAEQRRAAAELQRQQDELAAQRRAEADAAAEKQRKADLAAAKALREQQEKAEAERIAREAADTAIRNAAHIMFAALTAVADWLTEKNSPSELREKISIAINCATQPEFQEV